MALLLSSAWLFATASALSYNLPSTPPSNSSGQLAAAPVGVSFEFFAYPAYVTNVPATLTCLSNLQALSGTWPPIRSGGTTQDRATYNPSSDSAVTYTVANSGDAPSTLTFGPDFFTLAAGYSGDVIIGLNRRLNNISNTILAAKAAKSAISNLQAIELGNEPDPADEYASEVLWQTEVCANMSESDFISAGAYAGTLSISGLAAAEGSANEYVRDYCTHNYPQSATTANLENLMGHSDIASQIKKFAAQYSAAAAEGKPFILGETNSASGGGGGISPTFGAGLWILDYVMQTMIMGVEALYFHQGTIGNCQYCWWGRYDMGAPNYGAYFAAMALANADQIAPLDDQTTDFAAYAIYKNGSLVRVLLYNSQYYTSGSRPEQTWTLTGLTASSVTAARLTAPYATSRVDQGSNPTIAGGIQFQNGTCTIEGTETLETTTVSAGEATFTVGASQALLIYL